MKCAIIDEQMSAHEQELEGLKNGYRILRSMEGDENLGIKLDPADIWLSIAADDMDEKKNVETGNVPSFYFESIYHYEIPYTIKRGGIYPDNSSNTSTAAEFNECLLEDVEIIED